jgi:hypothetical protein
MIERSSWTEAAGTAAAAPEGNEADGSGSGYAEA